MMLLYKLSTMLLIFINNDVTISVYNLNFTLVSIVTGGYHKADSFQQHRVAITMRE